MGKRSVLVSIDVDILAETDRQIEDINGYRSKGAKLNRSMVIEKMLALWNRIGNGK